MTNLTTRKMSDAHEDALVAVLGGRKAKGSGNQWHGQMDGRTSHRHVTYAFAWDGKSTLGKSVGVSREMWTKAIQQAAGERPMLPLRFYDNERLDVGLDLVVMSLADASSLIEDANKLGAIVERGCLEGGHDFPGTSTCSVCGVDAYNLAGAES